MTQVEAYETGYDAGLGIGYLSKGNYPRSEHKRYLEECTDWEQGGYREFSPFELVAKAINEGANPDDLWAQYNKGVRDGLTWAWYHEHKRRNKG
jgi:hypothetical protein